MNVRQSRPRSEEKIGVTLGALRNDNGLTFQEDASMIDVTASNKTALKYVEQKLIEQINPLPQLETLSVMNGSSGQKISEDTVELNSPIHQPDIMDINRVGHSTAAEHTPHNSASRETVAKTGAVWGRKTHVERFKRIEITSSLVSDHDGSTSEINSREVAGKNRKIFGD